ncbi:hypothetical protein IVB02_29685 [Bradyrhizobium sp. 166]|uniref:hypothetical protein n=1 Tax=Bradyrhizobium sp. 166 TaxID=2782638 RepID=UPI001FF890D8|nr:hypothetical protein [Bradyrhizobium sp. 166]MCK1605458.1 hypothetical protein [Bradyrhizobium sp. 166]
MNDFNAAVHVTFFKDYAANTLTTDNLSLIELRERVLNASAREKGKLPWLKLALFGNRRSINGSLRHDANVTEVTGIELDYDDESVAFDDAFKAVSEMGIAALVYTSPSHRPWRRTLAHPRSDLTAASAGGPCQVGRSPQWRTEN